MNPMASDGSAPYGLIPGFTTLARTQDFPDTSVNKPFVELHGKKLPLTVDEGVTCRTVDFPPVPAEAMKSDTVNFMHRTQSVDFGVVLEGSIWAVMDSGEEKEMKPGDVCIQRGTAHVSTELIFPFDFATGACHLPLLVTRSFLCWLIASFALVTRSFL
jgi:hypothetical protein